jgi:hypothetical protein
MVNTLKLPVGIDSFEKIRRNGFYYIDKTNLIEQILMNWGEVTLFTRPRRFGKTLNMSMLKSFFEIGADVSLFEGLYIAKNKELCVHGKVSSDISHAQRGGGADICGCEEDARHDSCQ